MSRTIIYLVSLLFLVHTSLSASVYLPSILDRIESDNLLDEPYCPECEGRVSQDNSKRVKMMSAWARNGMPLSILYLKTKPNPAAALQREDIYPVNTPVVLPYRSNPSTRGFNSKIFQAASLGKPKPALSPAQVKQLQQTGSGTPMRRQSVVLPQMFLTYGFDNKKPFMERE